MGITYNFTPSMLNAFNRVRIAEEEDAETFNRAFSDFFNSLNGLGEQTDAMRRGIAVEDVINRLHNGEPCQQMMESGAYTIATAGLGGILEDIRIMEPQVLCHHTFTIDGDAVTVYGKPDYYGGCLSIDIKTTARYTFPAHADNYQRAAYQLFNGRCSLGIDFYVYECTEKGGLVTPRLANVESYADNYDDCAEVVYSGLRDLKHFIEANWSQVVDWRREKITTPMFK